MISYKNTRKIFLSSLFLSIVSLTNIMIDNFLVAGLGESSIKSMSIVTSSSPLILAFFSGARILFIKNMTNHHKEKDILKVRSLFTMAYVYMFVVIVLMLIIMISLKEILIDKRLNYDPISVKKANDIFLIQLVSAFIFGASMIFNWLFYVSKKNVLLTSITALGIAVNVTVSSILIFVFNMDVLGGAIGTLVSTLFIFVLKIGYLSIKGGETKTITPLTNFWINVNLGDSFKKWYAIPYEISFFLTGYLFFYVLNVYYPEEIIIYSVFSPFMYLVTGTVGISQIYMKFNYDKKIGREEQIKILKISWVRMNILSLILIATFSIIIFALDIYDISEVEKLYSFITFVVSTISLSISSPFYNLSFNIALYRNKSYFYIFDILTRTILIGCAVLAGVFAQGLMWFILMIALYQFTQSFLPFALTFKRRRAKEINKLYK